MDAFDSIRDRASALHEELVAKGVDPLNPESLVLAAVDKLTLYIAFLPPGDPALKGAKALFDEQAGTICCEESDDTVARALLVAHELGHAFAHAGSSSCSDGDIDPSGSIESARVGMRRVEDYGARERRELQANVFARELVLPRGFARELHVDRKMTAAEISARTGLPANLVRQQLFDALLLPPPPPVEKKKKASKGDDQKPDPSQERAASHRNSAFQLQAGPGTGKTRTLIRRVLSLLAEKVEPASILILTFSNKAAGELVERLEAAVPHEAPKIWVGTFHAFGLDLVRRYYDRFGLSPDPVLFDRTDTIEAMEEALPALPLVHYRNLWNPANELREILSAISRAKDELVDAAGYQALSQKMLDAAKTDDEREAAEKCLEVAAVYAAYEKLLAEHGAVDFGDLVMKPALMLERDDVARTHVQMRHRHVLVDEYQDVNRASARLLKEIAGDGKRLWVVGDTRQAIYRFRGASTSNMSEFKADYPDATPDKLEINYRSVDEVVKTFVSITPEMGASKDMLPLELTANRGAFGQLPEIRRLHDSDDELSGIAASIRELEAKGVELQDQAVLCRGNSRLSEIAQVLEACGIPSLYLGSLFERAEIRDLLSLLSLVVDPLCDALVRVGTLPRYNLTLQDVRVATTFLREKKLPALEGLKVLAGTGVGLSKDGAAGIKLLAADLSGFEIASSAWDVLSTYLLDITDGARKLSEAKTPAEFMRAIAVWQLLNFVREQPVTGKGFPIRRLLDRIRQLVIFADERELRRMPDAALSLNAVRLMTVHGSKGLEFEAVHIVTLITSSFPLNPKTPHCPPPVGLISGSGKLSVVDESKLSQKHEEECLFFVALSRARTYLRLYLSKFWANGKNKRTPSEFIAWLKPALVQEVPSPATLAATTSSPSIDQIKVAWATKPTFSDGRLASYEDCPRRCFYTSLLELAGGRKPSAITRTLGSVFDVIRWMADARVDSTLTSDDVEREFEKIWKESGPVDHAFASHYRALALKLAHALHASGADRKFRKAEPLGFDLASGKVVVEPHEIAELPDGSIVLRRVRTGAKKDAEFDELEYTLYHLAGQEVYGATTKVEAVLLADGKTEHAAFTPTKLKNRRDKAEKFMSGVIAGNFPPKPNERTCPTCPHYFICGPVPSGPLALA